MQFRDPYYLALLAAAAAAAWRACRAGRADTLLFPAAGRAAVRRVTWRMPLAALMPPLYLGGLVCLVLALARPALPLARTRRTAEAIGIEMVVDVSGSMAALDLSPAATGGVDRTRLDVVKDAFADFVSRRPDDLVGLVSFGGYAATRCPLTSDHEALLQVLKSVTIPGRDGDPLAGTRHELLTAIGDGLATACARLEKAPTASRVVVLLSDGESNTGIIGPGDAALAASRMGIRVYTIGVGSHRPAPFRETDRFGLTHIVKERVILDEALLARIADTTGGIYFRVTDRDGLARCLEQIDQLEKTTVETTVHESSLERFPRFLVPGLALTGLAGLVRLLLRQRIV